MTSEKKNYGAPRIVDRDFTRTPPTTPFDERGHLLMDPRPMAPPVGYKPSDPLADRIRAVLRSEQMAISLKKEGIESFEEANDFFIEDDPGSWPGSPYEIGDDAFEEPLTTTPPTQPAPGEVPPPPATSPGAATPAADSSKAPST